MEDAQKRGHQQESDGKSGSDSGIAPKKRGRPANPNKVKKPPSGRGRGRPAKNSSGAPTQKKSVNADGEGSGLANGSSNDGGGGSSGRGRPTKPGKLKASQSIEATGKGRGRPKNPPKMEQSDDEGADEEGDDDDDHPKAKKRPKISDFPKKLGRPQKAVNSEDEYDDKDEEHRPMGRPSTGAVNLNIVRTGRGQGRPKKVKQTSVDGGGTPKKRGRPPLGDSAKLPYIPTGKPRGRPSQNNVPQQINDGIADIDDDYISPEESGTKNLSEDSNGPIQGQVAA